MQEPQLGFKLRFRHFKESASKVFFKFLKNSVFEILGILLSTFALYYAITANNISNTALRLAQTDTTQTAQIERLNSAIFENQKQNATLSKQLETLILMASETKELNNSTYKLLDGSSKQSDLLNRQLILGLKTQNAALFNETVAKESDLFALHLIFDELISTEIRNSVGQLQFLYKNPLPDYGSSKLLRIKLLLGKGLSNKVFQTDAIIKRDWYLFYKFISDLTIEIDIFQSSISVNNPKRRDDIFKRFSPLSTNYADFFNRMQKSFNRKGNEFIFKNKIYPK